jgi:hypothetical protein
MRFTIVHVDDLEGAGPRGARRGSYEPRGSF